MMARWKKLYGGDLKSRCKERGKIEVKLKAMMINLMIDQAAGPGSRGCPLLRTKNVHRKFFVFP